MTAVPAQAAPEWERDQNETEFTEMLRAMRVAVPEIQVALFVDDEGECIDYVSTLEPYEAKVLGAQMHNAQRQFEQTDPAKVRAGYHFGLEVACGLHEVWARRINEDYVIVLRTAGCFEHDSLRSALVQTCIAFRALVGLDTPTWEPAGVPVDVETREAVGWAYAPVSFRDQGQLVAVSDVIGRWTEPVAGEETVCFRVRTEEGREVTLVHDHRSDGWQMRT